jgi:hypothetical protein
MAQENLIKASKIPFTIVRATQFFEFVGGIAQCLVDKPSEITSAFISQITQTWFGQAGAARLALDPKAVFSIMRYP